MIVVQCGDVRLDERITLGIQAHRARFHDRYRYKVYIQLPTTDGVRTEALSFTREPARAHWIPFCPRGGTSAHRLDARLTIRAPPSSNG